jgi:hypothetical protein
VAAETALLRGERRLMIVPDAADLGVRLDAHHLPETNGRMAICRRCGVQTDHPGGLHHLPHDDRLVRGAEWLDSETRRSLIHDGRHLP